MPQFYPNGTINRNLLLKPGQNVSIPIPTLYVPIFSLLEIAFYIGWLKVAQSLLNPFGDDDEDFDLISLMERNLAISLWMVDLQHGLPAQPSEDGQEEIQKESQRVSFTKPTDTLFFQQAFPATLTTGDPLSELLVSAAELRIPETLGPPGAAAEDMGGSAAIVFERKESRRLSAATGDLATRRPSRAAVSSRAIFPHDLI